MSHPLVAPIRERSAAGLPKPTTTIERTCRWCGASFLGLTPGKTGERGVWSQSYWWCSVECTANTAERWQRCGCDPTATHDRTDALTDGGES